MQFDSLQYIVFLCGVVFCYYLLPLAGRRLLLLAASFGFYAAWNAKYLLLMLAVIGVTYGAALAICRLPQHKNKVLAGCLAVVLGLLFYFKYLNFVIQSLNTAFGAGFELWNIVLPVGISFYVFQSLGYVVDVYRDAAMCERNLVSYALFVSFFPQLVAGPIERTRNMLNQLKTRQPFRLENLKIGITEILFGMVQKVVVADRLAPIVTGVFAEYQTASRSALILAAVFFAFQIYCDFGAYSLIAIGSARLMGYRLMSNFNSPYLARSFTDFWGRWHISLSTWFRDYLYIPLGGNRKGKLRTLFNLAAVFLVSGFWHGASWTFVAWGVCHAVFRVLEACTAKRQKLFLEQRGIRWDNPLLVLAQVLVTFALNCLIYVFFRADSIAQALGYLKAIFVGNGAGAQPVTAFSRNPGEVVLSLVLIAGMMICELWAEKRHKGRSAAEIVDGAGIVAQSVIYAGLFLLLVVCGTYGAAYVENPFIYFQF